MFYRAGIIERWGTGTLNIIDWCAENANPPPTWQEQAGSVYVTFLPAELPATRQVPDKYPASARQVTSQEAAVLAAASNPATRTKLQKSAGLRDREHFVNTCLNPLLEAGFLEMTIPDKPRSSKQKYRLTTKGQAVVKDKSGSDE